MKNKGIVAFIAGVALLANMAIFAIASAQTPSQGTVTTQGGNLVLEDVPDTQNFGTLTVSDHPISTGLGNFNEGQTKVIYSDYRGSGVGFNVNVTATKFLLNHDTKPGNTFAYTGLQLAYGTQVVCDASSDSGGLGATLLAPLIFSGGDGTTSTNLILVGYSTVPARDYLYMCGVTPASNVTIPAYQPVGTYYTTLTWQLV